MTGTRKPTILAKLGPADVPSPAPASTQQTRPPEEEGSDLPGGLGAGTVLSDRYALVEPLGRGGAGSVWRATHTVIGRQVAVKLLAAAPGSHRAAEEAERLLREAQALSRIRHPCVVEVIDHGYADDGTPFIAMELIEGQSLFAVLNAADGATRPWSWRRDVALQVVDGLVACHAVGVIHRDVKPENILISPRSGSTTGPSFWVTLVDFGIALAVQSTSNNPRLTRAGSVFGTPMYMSPEQAAASNVDERTDIYSFGCVLYELLAGAPPFDGTPSQVLAQHLAGEPPPLDHLAAEGEFPVSVLDIVKRCLAKNPKARYQSAGELYAALADPRLATTRSRARAMPAPVGWGLAAAGLGGLALLVALRLPGGQPSTLSPAFAGAVPTFAVTPSATPSTVDADPPPPPVAAEPDRSERTRAPRTPPPPSQTRPKARAKTKARVRAAPPKAPDPKPAVPPPRPARIGELKNPYADEGGPQ